MHTIFLAKDRPKESRYVRENQACYEAKPSNPEHYHIFHSFRGIYVHSKLAIGCALLLTTISVSQLREERQKSEGYAMYRTLF